ncbi:MAG: adenylate kinase [Caldisericaceae bacterium]
MTKRLVLFGPPGSGKDTQGSLISTKLGIPHIASGSALREEIANGTDIGKRFQSLINGGNLVPDEFMFEFLEKLLSRYSLQNGFVLNGFPRTVPQAEFLDAYLLKNAASVDLVVSLVVDESEIVKRLSGRRTCENCGAVYNVYYYPPKVEGICDICGGKIYQRDDDSEESVKKRIKVYGDETLPLFTYYSDKKLLYEVDGLGTVDEVNSRIMEILNDRN